MPISWRTNLSITVLRLTSQENTENQEVIEVAEDVVAVAVEDTIPTKTMITREVMATQEVVEEALVEIVEDTQTEEAEVEAQETMAKLSVFQTT